MRTDPNPAQIQLQSGVHVPPIVLPDDIQEHPLGKLEVKGSGGQHSTRRDRAVPAHLPSTAAEHACTVSKPESEVVPRKEGHIQAGELETTHHVRRKRRRHVLDEITLVAAIESVVRVSEAGRHVVLIGP